jgi:exodeoxyribonuclease VII small subunit
MAEKKPTFNEALEELELILKEIESGEMDVDDLTSKVKRAALLLDICNKKLKKTEEELDKIVADIE